MRYAPYEFKREDAYRFARIVKIHSWERGNELWFKSCPYCRGEGKSNEKTFSINLETGKFKCFRASCNAAGNMIRLSRDFQFSLGNEVDEYYKPKPYRKTFGKLKEPIKPKPKAIEYLESRGISEQITKRYEITTQLEHDNILVFPFFDSDSTLSYIKYRKIDYDKEKDKNKEWAQENGTPILFGIRQCNLDNKTLIITEGQIDSLSVAEVGYDNAVSVPTGANGFTWVPFCWNWIYDNFDTIIVFGDYEKGRITLLNEIKTRFKLTIKHVREEDYKDCKDANAILQKYGKEQIRVCIDNAVTVPIQDVIQLADVEYVNIYDLEKVKSGFKWLDRLLCGGIPFGGVVLISGKSGMGKSTLASQFIMNAMRQGYICFAYSGELPNYMFKSWFDFQLAGRGHIIEQLGRFNETQYVISQKNQEIMRNWYRDRFFLYDNNSVNDELTDLIKIIKNVILQYGVKVILLDNLMTAMIEAGTKGESELDKQKNFVNSLRNIGKNYNVLILLVAHKRKNGQGSETGDDIAGSSNIYNLALMNISYDADSDIEPGERKLKVTKNRYFGKVDTEGILVHYDEKSKRIYGDDDDLDEESECFKDIYGFSEINMETPFE